MISLLNAYLFVESIEDMGGYAIHVVIHKWIYHHHVKQVEADFRPLIICMVRWAILINLS